MKAFNIATILCLLLATLGYAQVVQVTDDNVNSLVTSESEWLLEFYAEWCGYCRKFAPKYEEVEDALSDSSVQVGKVDVESSPGLAARFFVQRLPTVVHIKDHQVRVVPHDKTLDLVGLIKREEWQDIKPVNAMTSPFSAVGTLVGFTGRMVKWASSLSPTMMVILMLVLLGVVVILPIYMPKDGDNQAQNDEQATEDTSSVTSARKPEPSSSSTTTKQRKSKRID
ncbi:predicted protein [Lichtheimia corymbifera JMRC:FSU:9682]|uniref:Thioredoxin domain-containing protein n=1 Tax=Lichtheimia corymbifera JMRC:FSU:9682 TaxID=1263082 RepID=A0A068RVJ9_9FUNG|nr:predicted protein [Lichtheimia corymbifera JMRC:FSU:9682]